MLIALLFKPLSLVSDYGWWLGIILVGLSTAILFFTREG